jgi:small-conductance mechanosensitive channel
MFLFFLFLFWVPGMLLVAVRRPFDLGDRIYMSDPSLIICDGLWYCWFVEDITLFHTTIRYAGTNEVATINNGSVANMRIINGARSPNAAVWFQFSYRPNLMEDGNMDKIKAALENYAKENPRDWHSYGYFRVDEVHPETERLVVTIGMNHRPPWQDLVRILEAKAKIMTWTMEYSRQLGVLYDELPKRDIMYYGGSLKEGGVHKHRYKLHDSANVVNGGFSMNQTSSPALSPQEATNAAFLSNLMQSQRSQDGHR